MEPLYPMAHSLVLILRTRGDDYMLLGQFGLPFARIEPGKPKCLDCGRAFSHEDMQRTGVCTSCLSEVHRMHERFRLLGHW